MLFGWQISNHYINFISSCMAILHIYLLHRNSFEHTAYKHQYILKNYNLHAFLTKCNIGLTTALESIWILCLHTISYYSSHVNFCLFQSPIANRTVLGLWLEFVVKVDEASEIKERACTRSCAQYKSTYTLYSRLMIRISRLILMYSRLISGLAVSFFGFIFSFKLDSSFLSSETVIVRIDRVCIGLGESYGL